MRLFGIIDAESVPDVIRHCQTAGFGLVLNPTRHMLKGNNTVCTTQSRSDIDTLLALALARLGLSFEWSAEAITKGPSKPTPVTLYHAASDTTVHGWTGGGDGEGNIRTNDTSPEAEALLSMWPDFGEILGERGYARLRIVKSAHEAMSLLDDSQGLMPGSAEAYLRARALRARKTT